MQKRGQARQTGKRAQQPSRKLRQARKRAKRKGWAEAKKTGGSGKKARKVIRGTVV